MPLGEQVADRYRVPDFYRRQDPLLIAEFRFGIVGAFDISPQIAGEFNRFAGDLKDGSATFDLQGNGVTLASTIWLAMVRFQMRSNSRNWS